MSDSNDPFRLLARLAREQAMGRPEHVVQAFHDVTSYLRITPDTEPHLDIALELARTHAEHAGPVTRTVA